MSSPESRLQRAVPGRPTYAKATCVFKAMDDASEVRRVAGVVVQDDIGPVWLPRWPFVAVPPVRLGRGLRTVPADPRADAALPTSEDGRVLLPVEVRVRPESAAGPSGGFRLSEFWVAVEELPVLRAVSAPDAGVAGPRMRRRLMSKDLPLALVLWSSMAGGAVYFLGGGSSFWGVVGAVVAGLVCFVAFFVATRRVLRSRGAVVAGLVEPAPSELPRDAERLAVIGLGDLAEITRRTWEDPPEGLASRPDLVPAHRPSWREAVRGRAFWFNAAGLAIWVNLARFLFLTRSVEDLVAALAFAVVLLPPCAGLALYDLRWQRRDLDAPVTTWYPAIGFRAPDGTNVLAVLPEPLPGSASDDAGRLAADAGRDDRQVWIFRTSGPVPSRAEVGLPEGGVHRLSRWRTSYPAVRDGEGILRLEVKG